MGIPAHCAQLPCGFLVQLPRRSKLGARERAGLPMVTTRNDSLALYEEDPLFVPPGLLDSDFDCLSGRRMGLRTSRAKLITSFSLVFSRLFSSSLPPLTALYPSAPLPLCPHHKNQRRRHPSPPLPLCARAAELQPLLRSVLSAPTWLRTCQPRK